MTEAIFFKNQKEFSDWLEENSEAEEIWVGYHKKSTGRQSLTWSSSVDVAICCGWIDGIRKSIDENSYKIRFTPRNPNSDWSAINVKKAKALIEEGRMQAQGLKLFNNRKHEQGYSSRHRNAELDAKYLKKLKSNKPAWKFFTNLAPSYKRDSIWWVMSAKQEATQLRRLNILIESSAEGQKIPHLRK